MFCDQGTGLKKGLTMVLAILKGSPGKTGDIVVDCVPFFVGRCKTANLIVPHVNISRKHCQILLEDSVWLVKDTSSSGTYINGCLIGKENQKAVKTGDLLRFGYIDFEFTWTFYSLKDVYSYQRHNECEGTSGNAGPGMSHKQLDQQCNSSKEFGLFGLEDKNNQYTELLHPGNPLSYGHRDGITGVFNSHVQSVKIETGCINNMDIKIDKSNNDVEKQQQHSFSKGDTETNKFSSMKKQNAVANTQSGQPKLDASTTVLKGLQVEQHTGDDESLIDKALAVDNVPKVRALQSKSLSNKEQELVKKPEETECALMRIESNSSTLLTELTTLQKDNEAHNSKLQVVQNFTEIMETELQCTICSELLVNSITLGCSHSFCQFCLNQWKKKQKTCPICRKNITVETKSLVIDNYIEKMIEQLPSEVKERRLIVINERKQPPSPNKKTKNKRKNSKFR